ncbi:SVEP1-like protein [Mya arenaria]|uniref:SVEP1-like protein n=1 Tax=Mya arenaria TaxID=6604 RepID=A0ABY7EW25_MYAAR|nr:SVEP1-like protein [Mya arenaria]
MANEYSCTCNSQWSDSNCYTPAPCSTPGEVSQGTRSFSDTNHASNVTYSCNAGYEITSGDATLTCNHGSWTGSLPTCEDIDECANNPCQNSGKCSNLVNAYRCTCNSQWTGTNCDTPAPCSTPSEISQGSGTYSDTLHGSTVTFACISGYEIKSGDASRTCSYGSWNGSQPTCGGNLQMSSIRISPRMIILLFLTKAIQNDANSATKYKRMRYKPLCKPGCMFKQPRILQLHMHISMGREEL